ncbi:MAG: hypothetical protein JKY76_01640, partial [Proteobacteria bacterium]|nr:hypothetical protein [Pseudomonadota bacterium]
TAGGATVALTGIGSATAGTVNDVGDGTYTFTLKSQVVEALTVGATIAAVGLPGTAAVSFTPGAVVAANSTITVSSATELVSADGSDYGSITVQLKDAYDNNVTSSGGTVELFENGSATISSIADNTDGTYSATITNTVAQVIDLTGRVAGVDLEDITTSDIQFVTTAPGSVATNFRMWLDADTGTNTDTDGGAISYWTGKGVNGFRFDQGTASRQPALNAAESDYNFHRSIYFDGSSDVLFRAENGPNDSVSNDIGYTKGELWVFIVANIDDRSSSQWGNLFAFGNSDDADEPRFGFDENGRIEIETNGTKSYSTGTDESITEDELFISTYRYSDDGNCCSSNAKLYNWLNSQGNSSNSINTGSRNYEGDHQAMIGADNNVTSGTDIMGHQAEIILYAKSSVDSSMITDTKRRQIETYLAIKYGITLNDDYIKPDGGAESDIYTLDGTYDNDIFGLGKKVTSGLDQRVARIWPGNNITVSTDTDYTSANASHANTLADDTYLIIGRDSGAESFSTTDIPTGFKNRVIRRFKVTDTGSVGAVNVNFSSLPTASAGEYWALIEDADGTFATGSSILDLSTGSSFEDVTFTPNATNYFTIATIPAPSTANTTITASPTTVTADGATISTITVQAKSSTNVNIPVGGATIVLSETGSATISSVTDNEDGTYTATVTSTTAETVTISATVNGSGNTDTADVTFEADVADPTLSTITAATGTETADGTTVLVTLQAIDANGNLATSGGEAVTMSVSGNASISVVSDVGNGTYTATVSNLVAESVIINGTTNTFAVTDTAVITFTPGPAAATSTITVDNATPTTDDTVTITVQAIDANGNNITAASAGLVTLTDDSGTAGISVVTDNNNGTYTATLTNTAVETVNISGVIAGITITSGDPAVAFAVGAVDETTSTISVSSGSVTTDDTVVVTVQAKDAAGNNLPAGTDTVVISSSLSGVISSDSDVGDGTYTANVNDGVIETVTITATINGQTITTGNPTVAFAVGAVDETTSTISVSSGS